MRTATITIGAGLLTLLALSGCTSSTAPPTRSSASSRPSTSSQPGSPAPSGTPSSSTPPPLVRAAGWQEIALPVPGARIVTMTALGNSLLALGSAPGPQGPGPAAWSTTDARTWHRLNLKAVTGYGQQAEFIMAGVAGGRIAAYGQAFGGAHGNPRPTIWTGTSAGLTEQVESFTLFGGEDAISVAAEAARPGQVLLAGSWDGASGRYGAAVWTSPDGAQWTRYADAPHLTSAPGEQTAAHGAAASADGFLVVGDTATSGPAGELKRALGWRSPDGRSWQRVTLSANSDATATTAACDADGCLILGSTATADQHLLCWPLTAAGRATAAVAGPGHGLVEVSQALLTGSHVYVVSDVDRVAGLTVADRDCGGWHAVPVPVAARQAVVGQVGGQLLLSTTSEGPSRLWRRG